MDAFDRDIEFVRDDLCESGSYPLSDFAFAGRYRDRAVCVDSDPGIQIGVSVEVWR
jgi:hypothetical protein